MKIEGLNGRLFAPYQRDGGKWMLGMEAQTLAPRGAFSVTKWVWVRPCN